MSRNSNNWFVRLLEWFADFLLWVARQLADPAVRASVAADLGIKIPSAGDPPFPNMQQHFDSIDGYLGSSSVDAEVLQATVEEMRAVRQALRDFYHATQGNAGEDILDGILRLMAMNYLRLRVPLLYWLAQPLQLLDDTTSAGILPGVNSDDIDRGIKAIPGLIKGIPAGIEDAARAVASFFEHPVKHIESISVPLQTEADAQLLSDIVFPPVVLGIAELTKKFVSERRLKQSDFAVLYGWEPDAQSQTPIADAISGRTLSFSVGSAQPASNDPIQGSIEMTMAFVPAAHGGPGFYVSVGGSATVEGIGGEWKIKGAILTADAFSILFKSSTTGSGPADAGFEFSLEHIPNPSGLPQTLDIKTARIEFGDFKITTGFSENGFTFHALADKSAFVFDTQSDTVTQRASAGNTEALRAQIGIGIGYANGAFSFDGGSGLLITVPLAIKLGPFQLRAVTLGLQPGSQPDQPYLTMEGSLTLVVKICCVTLTVDRIGLGFTLDDKNGSDVGHQGPKGVGIAIDSDCFSGGGYLFYDHTASQYAGVFSVKIHHRITVTAVGLLTTKIGDKKAFSFLVIVSVSGLKIPLPLGFTLSGIGGLFGLDRTMDITTIEAGVKAHTLDYLMFPTDPVANAPAIVNAVAGAFPPLQSHYAVGLFLQVTWQSDRLVRLELGVVYQWPQAKLVIFGKARSFFPTEKNPISKLQLDLLGDFDFDQKRAFAYATLNDSKLASLSITGEAAMLCYWGDNGTFLFSIGGFNPRFQSQVPSEFPSLKRLDISFKKSDSLTIDIQFYLAITSHSFQFGGSVSFKAKESQFSIEGIISIDALFQHDEPTFAIDLKIKLELKAWDVSLFLVLVQGSFAGFHPKHVQAQCTFEIFIFSHTFSLDKCWGDTSQVQQPSTATDVNAAFIGALNDPNSWNTGLPPEIEHMVTLRPPGASLVLHPLGIVSVLQRVVPLGINIERYGNGPVQGATLFEIDAMSVGGVSVPFDKVQDQFARSQYLTLTDDQKLSTPSFERMDAGLQISQVPLSAGNATPANASCRTLIYNAATGEAEPDNPYTLTTGVLNILTLFSAAAKNAKQRGGSVRYKGPSNAVTVARLSYVLASTSDMTPAPVGGQTTAASSFSAASMTLRQHLEQNPGDRQRVQILPSVAG